MHQISVVAVNRTYTKKYSMNIFLVTPVEPKPNRSSSVILSCAAPPPHREVRKISPTFQIPRCPCERQPPLPHSQHRDKPGGGGSRTPKLVERDFFLKTVSLYYLLVSVLAQIVQYMGNIHSCLMPKAKLQPRAKS